MDEEKYLIPYPNLDFAIELCNEILIPLSKKFKKLSKEGLDEISDYIYSKAGRMKIITEYNEATGDAKYYWGKKSNDKNLSDYENWRANFEKANPHFKN